GALQNLLAVRLRPGDDRVQLLAHPPLVDGHLLELREGPGVLALQRVEPLPVGRPRALRLGQAGPPARLERRLELARRRPEPTALRAQRLAVHLEAVRALRRRLLAPADVLERPLRMIARGPGGLLGGAEAGDVGAGLARLLGQPHDARFRGAERRARVLGL